MLLIWGQFAQKEKKIFKTLAHLRFNTHMHPMCWHMLTSAASPRLRECTSRLRVLSGQQTGQWRARSRQRGEFSCELSEQDSVALSLSFIALLSSLGHKTNQECQLAFLPLVPLSLLEPELGVFLLSECFCLASFHRLLAEWVEFESQNVVLIRGLIARPQAKCALWIIQRV